MYLQERAYFEQINITFKLSRRLSTYIPMHWLDPLSLECVKQLYPDRIL